MTTFRCYRRGLQPNTWPTGLYRVNEANGHAEELVHGIWSKSLIARDIGGLSPITESELHGMRNKREIDVCDADTWGACLGSQFILSSLVEKLKICAVIPMHQIGAVAKSAWDSIDFSFVSMSVLRISHEELVHGIWSKSLIASDYFYWVQRSHGVINDHSFIGLPDRIQWYDVQTSRFRKLVAANKQYDEWMTTHRLPGNVLIENDIRYTATMEEDTLVKSIRKDAIQMIVNMAQAEKKKEEQKRREQEEREAAQKREQEEREAAQKREAAEARKREQEQARSILEKDPQNLSPEEFAKRMRIKREKANAKHV